MPDNTLTLALEGEVTLSDFAVTMQHFASLVAALSAEVASGVPISWDIDTLEAGSAQATVRGSSEQEQVVERVVRAYAAVGTTLEDGYPIAYSEPVRKHAAALTSVLGAKIIAVRFETQYGESTVASSASYDKAELRIKYTLGSLRGIVETLSQRRGLMFILYDPIFDRPVKCYLSAGQEDKMRDIWGKRVAVQGRIGREPVFGRPVAMRDITGVRLLPALRPGSFKLARGVLPFDPQAEKPEDQVRRLRDAW